MSGRQIDAFLEERLNDIDELIQCELGHANLNITEPLAALEIHNLSSMLETKRTSSGLLSRTVTAVGEYTSCLSLLWSIS